MLEDHHLAVEGVVALMHRKTERLGKHVAIVISGGNVSLETLRQVVREEYPYQVEG